MIISSFRPTRGHLGCDGLAHGSSEALPTGDLFAELTPAVRREVVELGAAIVLRDSPSRLDPAFARHAIERRVERTLLDAKDVLGCGLDPAGDPVAVHRAPGQRLENE